ncbi:MAG: DUF559 domain-containing protein [Atopobiaceae bacterium]|nr:DUF559 domain-containing protein [Atopobiaceae bacterium]
MAWVADMLASPRESEAYLFATLPRKSGGFNLPRPSANVKVHVKGTTAENLTAKEYFKVDLMWEDKKVVLEYDGIDDHEKDPAKMAEDKERRSVLAALGYTVIVMTRRDLESEWTLRSKMAQVALALGTELPVFDAQEARTHAVLFKWLTNPFHDHMPFGCGYR